MPEGVTTIGHKTDYMRTYVYSDPKNRCIRIAQGLWELIDDEISIRSEETAKDLISYITNRINDPIWGGDGNEAKVSNGNGVLALSTRSASGDYGSGILIEQATSIVITDCILSDSPERARKLISALRRRGKELGWNV